MSELLEWLLNPDNRKSCIILGLIFIFTPLIFLLSGGFSEGADGHGIIFSIGWFREIFLIIMSIMFLLGLILFLARFRKKKND